MKELNIAIAGATGLVGQEVLRILEERHFPIRRLFLYASPASEGKTLIYKGKNLLVQILEKIVPKGIDILFWAAGGRISRDWIPLLLKEGVTVIDKSSTYRMQADVPLVVPYINEASIGSSLHIATPNCTTIQLVLAIYPLRKWGFERIDVTALQAVSGTGKAAVQELNDQIKASVDGYMASPSVYPHQIFDNLIPQIGGFDDDGYATEEVKVRDEGRKILSIPELDVYATCIRVPIPRGHSLVVSLKTKKPTTIDEMMTEWRNSPYLRVVDYPDYPMPLTASYIDLVEVGRLRRNSDDNRNFTFFCCGDNLRVGAALNAVRIAEYLLTNRF